ncbi:MAG: response regulator [Leptospiraceae bacterium]|nr:response regulator [Leptospiraceae bacterium]
MKKILLIEDEDGIRENIAEILVLSDFEVVQATNGQDGIKLALFEKPDVIICDIKMPEMDGYEVLHYIRQNESICNIPFIFLTARVEKDDFRKGMNLGADDYLTKPCTSKELLDAIYARIERTGRIRQEIKEQMNHLVQELNNVSSHEFRTPLTSILGFAQIIKSYIQELDKNEILKIAWNIEQSGMRLQKTIENIILYQSILKNESAYPKITPPYLYTPINDDSIYTWLKEVIDKYDRETDIIIKMENTKISVQIEDLKKTIKELIDNALKFSQKGKQIRVTGIQDNNVYKIEIFNEGFGFKEGNIHKIGPFIQFDRSTYQQQGSGLGLFISKKLIERNMGKFQIESIENEYAKIIIEFRVS